MLSGIPATHTNAEQSQCNHRDSRERLNNVAYVDSRWTFE